MARAKVKGEDKLIAKLGRMGDAILARVRDVMSAEADEVVATMKALCPVEEGKPDLRGTISWFCAPDPTRPETLRIRFTVGNHELYYAPFLEFGTIKMTSKPFFLPAWRQRKAAMIEAMKAAMVAAVEATARG